MMRVYRFTSAVIITALVVIAAPAAQTSGPPTYDLSWHTIDTGGGTSTGGAFELAGTIGQHDAGGPMTGGAYALTGGFWAGPSGEIITCPADLTGDNIVGVADLLQLLADWNTPGSDIDGDNNTGVSDLLALLAAWGTCPP